MAQDSPFPPTPLERLATAIACAEAELPFVQLAGTVREISPSHYRVRGLSSVVKLGDRLRIDNGETSSLGEVVRVGETDATVKPFQRLAMPRQRIFLGKSRKRPRQRHAVADEGGQVAQ